MTTYTITCTGPGPHDPTDGVLGIADRPQRGEIRCGASACAPTEPPSVANDRTVRDLLAQALATNRAFLAQAKPATAAAQASSAYDQARALSRQQNLLIRLALGDLSGTD